MYFNSEMAATNETLPDEEATTETTIVHKRTLLGQFGWSILGTEHIPFIFRGDDNYYAVRMVQHKVLHKYLSVLDKDVYSFIHIPSYYVTEVERELLTEINVVHCSSAFGEAEFTCCDLLVKLNDAVEFYNYLNTCHNILQFETMKSKTESNCGFAKINSDIVPFVILYDEPYIPLFHLEREKFTIELPIRSVEGWDLCYLKFCCMLQGTPVLDGIESCMVVNLNKIKQHFTSGTTIDTCWPDSFAGGKSLLNKATTIDVFGLWTKPTRLQPYPNCKPDIVVKQPITKSAAPIENNNCLRVRKPNDIIKLVTPNNIDETKPTQKTYRFNSLQIPDLSYATLANGHYKIKLVLIEDKIIETINMAPNNKTVVLITISDFIKHLFSHVSLEKCVEVMQDLDIDLYKPNSIQFKLLLNNGNLEGKSEDMVQLRDVLENMSKFKKIFMKE